MGLHVGIDVGAAGARMAVRGSRKDTSLQQSLLVTPSPFLASHEDASPRPSCWTLLSEVAEPRVSPADAARRLFDSLQSRIAPDEISATAVVGSGAALLAPHVAGQRVNACRALTHAMARLHPSVRTVIEIGAESARFLRLEPNASDGKLCIQDHAQSGDCAAGTGSFLDTQATRLGIPVERMAAATKEAPSAARIAGRCSVFAESDMIHAQQRGHTPAEVLRGLCDAIARNIVNGLLKGHDVVAPVALIGGVALNEGVVRALRDRLRMTEEQCFVPRHPTSLGAVGAALLSGDPMATSTRARPPRSRSRVTAASPTRTARLCRDAVRIVTNGDAMKPNPEVLSRGYLGVDVGSISTNVVVLDESGDVWHESYLRTAGKPIDAVKQGLRELAARSGSALDVLGVGTTGSGRELIGEIVGADVVCDEITAHKIGAVSVSRALDGPLVDTIFEIGGQDSKFIALEDGIVVDFTMNEACAAGTGSFLEEQAEKLGICIEREFADLAFASTSPCGLGERCTVFMEREVVHRRQQGAAPQDLAAGLAYAVALNYLNRVVRGRRVGEAIFFQGGTAYNQAVAAAFASLTGKRITVPPHCGVLGAIGAALKAREELRRRPRATRFRGYDLDAVPMTCRSFVCKGCTNRCDVRQYTVEGQRTYWGDRCSERYRKPALTDRRPVIPDLMAHREDTIARFTGSVVSDAGDTGPQGERPVGMLRCSSVMDRPVFWHTYVRALGLSPVFSPPTDTPTATRGAALALAAPCHPIQVAHGQAAALLDEGVEALLVPNVRDEAMREDDGLPSHLCPWNQVLPFVLRSCPGLEHARERILAPTVHFRLGRRHVQEALAGLAAKIGIARRVSDRAVRAAYEREQAFRRETLAAGADALEALRDTGEPGLLLLGRTYNLYDRMVNCDIPRKLRSRYGANVLPLDYLVPAGTAVSHLHPNMYWASGRRILAAAEHARAVPNFHVIYITNFKCGPDSYLKSIVRDVLAAPLLHLQFDGHAGDAGYLTRCEAFLESKGVLRC